MITLSHKENSFAPGRSKLFSQILYLECYSVLLVAMGGNIALDQRFSKRADTTC